MLLSSAHTLLTEERSRSPLSRPPVLSTQLCQWPGAEREMCLPKDHYMEALKHLEAAKEGARRLLHLNLPKP